MRGAAVEDSGISPAEFSWSRDKPRTLSLALFRSPRQSLTKQPPTRLGPHSHNSRWQPSPSYHRPAHFQCHSRCGWTLHPKYFA